MWEAAMFGGKYGVSDADPEAMHLLLIGLLHVQPHIIYHAKQFTLLRQKMANALEPSHGLAGGIFLLSLFICVLDKSYFWVLPLFLYFFVPLSLHLLYLPLTLSPSFFSLCHLYSFCNCSFVWKASDWGLRRPDGIVIRERDRQRAVPPPNKRTLESPQRYLDSGCSATATRGFGRALIMPAAEWIEAAKVCIHRRVLQHLPLSALWIPFLTCVISAGLHMSQDMILFLTIWYFFVVIFLTPLMFHYNDSNLAAVLQYSPNVGLSLTLFSYWFHIFPHNSCSLFFL